MIIEAVSMRGPDPGVEGHRKAGSAKELAHEAYASSEGHGTWVDHMATARPGLHARGFANILAIASGWAYSDIDTFARVMARRGGFPGNEIVGVTNANPVLFVDTTAYLVQSADRRVAILAFRGTGLQNATNWLTDASAHQEVFPDAGHVHTGFFRATLVLLPVLIKLLRSALKGYSICDAAIREKAVVRDCMREARGHDVMGHLGANEGEGPDVLRHLPAQPAPGDKDVLEALYITGHSLGGALAVIMAALVEVTFDLADIRRKLRGVYTYGQPMVGDKDFADRFDGVFGKKLFRHVYRQDIVPRLPPITTGSFRHFGQEYAAGDGGWEYRSKEVSQALTFLGSNVFGLFALAQKVFAGIPVLQWLPIPPNWAHHAPINYLRTSQTAPPGSEFL
ncbi:lipase family protein [Sorangium sp. So ce1128]